MSTLSRELLVLQRLREQQRLQRLAEQIWIAPVVVLERNLFEVSL